MRSRERARRLDERSPPAGVDRAERARLFVLLGVLVLAAAVYGATGRWRQRLREESARSRRVIAAVEGARSAAEQRAARERELQRRLLAQPQDEEARLELAQMRWRTGGPQAAAAVLRAAGASPGDPRLVSLLAAAERAMGREDRALATLDRALRRARAAPRSEQEPSWAGILQGERALLFALMGWFPQAESALKEAERAGAPALQTALVRATMARQHVDLRTARRVLEAAHSRHPEDADVIRQLAAVAEGERRFDEATRLLQSIAEREADPQVWVALARNALRRFDPGARAEAKRCLERALALQPAMPAARLLLARCHRLEGNLDRARAILEPLHRERPRHGMALFELAQVYQRLGRHDLARPLLARYKEQARRRRVMLQAANAVMTAPESARAHAEVGRLCLEEGKIGRAILSLERALALDPGLTEARAGLARARQATVNAVSEDE